jgi:hypothetical protein
MSEMRMLLFVLDSLKKTLVNCLDHLEGVVSYLQSTYVFLSISEKNLLSQVILLAEPSILYHWDVWVQRLGLPIMGLCNRGSGKVMLKS